MKLIITIMFSLLLSVSAAYSQTDVVESTRLLAEQGDAYAQAYLGYMYDTGNGVSEDHDEAFKWYQLAADQGLASGSNNLGILYAEGKGVPQNDLAAYVWFTIAAVQSYEGAIKSRDEIAEKLSDAELSKGSQIARRCIDSAYTECEFD